MACRYRESAYGKTGHVVVVDNVDGCTNFISRRYLKVQLKSASRAMVVAPFTTMKFSEARIPLLVFAVLCGVYCSDDSDGVPGSKVGENLLLDYRDVETSFAARMCEEHEEYSECSGDPTCQRTCENVDQWETMLCTRTKVCIRGCVCEDGYVRVDYNGICVRENSCPRVRH